MGEGSDINEVQRLRPSQVLAEKPNISDKRKCRLFLEPALVGAMMAINLGQTSLQNFYLRTACTIDLNKDISICDRGVGEDFRAAEAESQIVVASINVSRSFIGSLISTAVLLFVGPWSDCSGRRKPLLIMPLVGMSVMTTGVLLMLIFPGANTTQVLYMVQIPISLGGNFGLLLAAAFSHIGDVCHATGRDVTRTMGTHRAAIQIAHVLGAVGGPLLYRHLGFYGVFPLVLLLQLSSLIYVIWFVKDVNVNKENTVSAFHWRLPINAVKCLFRKRDGYKRTVILLMLVVALADRMFLSAEVLLAYMYYRYKFHWDDVMFGSFLAYRNIISFIGTLLILMVLQRRFKLSDEVVGALSCFSYVLAQSGLVLATTTLFVFFIPLIGIISQGSQVVQRPLLNKQILPTEQGKIYSVLGALESATQTFSSPLYSLLYSKTVNKYPDAWLIPGIFLALLQILAYLKTRRLGQKAIETNVEVPVKRNIPLEILHKPESEKPMLSTTDDGIQKDLRENKT
ncbi:unnamed protein product [Diatraea saccharalis]|uniref:Proton-coupled folate transporter n=1 Tax=Diatraea saccharalis TaxID=40085 RepID=A0A9N9R071_9NEOP|nr:unnamed protein product [Diatraea saccharalis]